ncbi:MAG: hypothetical protein F4Y08_05045 [Caldilineaceae bacterium SB0662_bin_9]|uniref:Uncharacterized protein n=1 Tax=Caldilineaceae bacterium SB0662_bin_9 TaxID=2605258 RepID=A0A6B1DSN3_9CHLR|nr:hypothetical protein [Caldilineaceae bacterium SB0662_bin_9]
MTSNTLVLHHYSDKSDFQWDAGQMCGDIPGRKPGGLWLSDDSKQEGWLSVCRHVFEDAKLRYQYQHECVVALDRILWLQTRAAMERFNSNYGAVDKPEACLHIDWGRVKDDYGGILIIPFHPSLSKQKPFYDWYRFDCASGCIWDRACLVRVTSGIKTKFPWDVPE